MTHRHINPYNITTFLPLALSGCAHSSAHIRYLKLPPVFRAQVGSEATDPILCWASAVSMLQMLDGAACFAVLEVLSVPPSRERVQRRVLMTVLRALSYQGTVVYCSSCDGLGRCTRTGCVSTFLVRESASVASPVGVVLDPHATHIPPAPPYTIPREI